MNNKSNYNYLLSDLTKLKGVGIKTMRILKKKKINTIFDLLWKLPKTYTDRSLSSKVKDLRIGEIQTMLRPQKAAIAAAIGISVADLQKIAAGERIEERKTTENLLGELIEVNKKGFQGNQDAFGKGDTSFDNFLNYGDG